MMPMLNWYHCSSRNEIPLDEILDISFGDVNKSDVLRRNLKFGVKMFVIITRVLSAIFGGTENYRRDGSALVK